MIATHHASLLVFCQPNQDTLFQGIFPGATRINPDLRDNGAVRPLQCSVVSLRQPCVTRGPAYFGEESVARDPADRGSGQLRPASDLGFADAGAIEVEF